MAFSEELKLIVKKKAMFQCCRCRAIGIDIHHIIPQKDNGPDTFDNAAPLCQNCHDQFGDNPIKRKEIKQMGFHWYETVERMYSSQASSLLPLVEKINQGLEEIRKEQSKKDSDITEIKNMLKEVSNRAIDNMTLGTANVTASNVVMASGASLSNINIDDIPELVLCQGCGKFFTTKSRTAPCPGCGSTRR